MIEMDGGDVEEGKMLGLTFAFVVFQKIAFHNSQTSPSQQT